MNTSLSISPAIDYLVVGHLTRDIQGQDYHLGGSAAYVALTVKALGLRPGIITAFADEDLVKPLQLESIPIINLPTLESTTFSNVTTPFGRLQTIHARADVLSAFLVPQNWRKVPILHLAPVAQEIEPEFVRIFPDSFIGITPQGWLREWDEQGIVHPTEWPEASFILPYSNATVLSIEDVDYNEDLIEEFAASCHILAVTEAAEGCRVYWNGDVRRFHPPPNLIEVDSTGAGDIFAAAFFIRLFDTHDPWEAGRFATYLASYSISRIGLDSIPTQEEIENTLIEVY
ncbi:MAG: PfkB family carbohydrate kinase [Anaerolineales bacterium]